MVVLPRLLPAGGPAGAQTEVQTDLPVRLAADGIVDDAGRVTATGNAEVYQGERTLTPDRIVYDDKTGLRPRARAGQSVGVLHRPRVRSGNQRAAGPRRGHRQRRAADRPEPGLDIPRGQIRLLTLGTTEIGAEQRDEGFLPGGFGCG
jgi:hypothetical protein